MRGLKAGGLALAVSMAVLFFSIFLDNRAPAGAQTNHYAAAPVYMATPEPTMTYILKELHDHGFSLNNAGVSVIDQAFAAMNHAVTLSESPVTVYQCPVSTKCIVVSFRFNNNGEDTENPTYTVAGQTFPAVVLAAHQYSVLQGEEWVLKAGDTVVATASSNVVAWISGKEFAQ